MIKAKDIEKQSFKKAIYLISLYIDGKILLNLKQHQAALNSWLLLNLELYEKD